MSHSISMSSTPIPYSRVVLGGLLGGLLSNLSGIVLGASVLHAELGKILQAMDNPPGPTRMLVEHVLMRFGIGFAAAWLYAAIRPRFSRRATAIVAAATFVWLTSYLSTALLLEELRIYSMPTASIGAAWGLVELIVVVTAAAWIHGTAGAGTKPG